MPSSPRRVIAILLSTSLFVVAGASAAPRHAATSADGPGLDLLGLVRTALTFLWAAEGCSADPDGRCGAAPAAPESEAGCSADPNGHCATTPAVPETDNGCHIDPDGRCASGS